MIKPAYTESLVQSPNRWIRPEAVRRWATVLICACAAIAAGCHRQSNTSYYGLAWVTVSSEPGGVTAAAPRMDFTSYIVTIDSLTLTRNDGIVVTALASPEIVDFAQLEHNAELWGTATIPDGTYVAATITLDYSAAVITGMVNGVPTLATVCNAAGTCNTATTTSITTFQVGVKFDPSNPLVVTPTYASTSATRLAIDFDLGASGLLQMSGSTLQYVANPFMTIGVLPSDNKLIRIRGALANTNSTVTTGGSSGTYSLYVRPFHDVVDNLGSLSLFSTPNTIFSLNGVPYTGNAGIVAMSLLSAGTTYTAAYATFVPDYNAANGAHAGTFYPAYVIAGSTFEDNYTQGLSGEVIARSGNTLTLRGSTLSIPQENLFEFETTDSTLVVGPSTLVTADDTTLTGLSYASIAVGQHIESRGISTATSNGTVSLDATGATITNTGSVRLISTELWGSLISEASGSLVMSVAAINGWPVTNYIFTGNGTSAAADPTSGNFVVDTGALTLPADLVVGGALWVDGLVTPFASAPPDFTASAVNSETSVQVAAGSSTPPGTLSCGLGSQVCEPAVLRVLYNYTGGTSTPFASPLTDSGFVIDMANPALLTAVIEIGPETIDLATVGSNPTVVPTSLPLTSTFGPQFSIGNPSTAELTTTVTTATTTLNTYSAFSGFVTDYGASVSTTSPVLQIAGRGVYDRPSNTFTATDIDVVL